MDSLRQIFATFGVTWPTFIAQVITVLIVYFVLSRYAFGPIIQVLEERRRRIAEGQANAERIKRELAVAEAKYREILNDANARAQQMLDEVRLSSDSLAERRKQEAAREAERIVARAQEATHLEHERVMTELRREVGRLVIETTAKVSGKVLTSDDQARLNEETSRQIAA